MKKWFTVLTLSLLVLALAACGAKNANNAGGAAAENAASNAGAGASEPITLKVGASPVPHAEILNHIKDALAKEGVNLEVVEFTDYVQPNVQLYEKKLDANFFQHVPYLDEFNKERSYDLVSVGTVHVEPIGAYSDSLKSKDELKDGATIAIPNDATNGGRALKLLADNGLITLKDGAGISATVKDIATNPKNLKFKELEAATLPRVLSQVDIAIINTNYALDAKLNPTKDALFIEGKDSPYANIVAARPDNKDSEGIQKLIKALNSDDVKKFIEDNYAGAIVPAF
ncbi:MULTISPECIES: MetQ/NlpA family ABC transporter substrate-binding protein [unclassified Paenibacillus]|uniref:MetQ/NlpA family ABC transporter substrate-binding protein n=1 Tax=unclassified Paenibacillus TaxID=185978 RepID=UPI00095423B8|nr:MULTISPECIES: MetQ/NlpA family ABC transporter substrate-binding protein [unclassified Paenibacillus]ASS66107.1 ABC transporter substrate-binding protein [Paenibacillus sp. RUD330]SIQ12366.1 D-methionine transport system substrate-binding protein [Paenibacillus sp. RU4X]SIQ34050.1 D-methionine transport system substrate-binding protein [Paenibacillus sp. RU4T]